MNDLPVTLILPELKSALADHPAAVLQAPPGAGKTTMMSMMSGIEPIGAGGLVCACVCGGGRDSAP